MNKKVERKLTNQHQIKGVLFDFNGTLLFDEKYHVEAWRELLPQIMESGSELVERDRLIGRLNKDILLEMNPALTEEEIVKYSLRKEEIYREICQKENATLVEGATSYFQYLKENDIPFTIVSASIYENIQFFYTYFHLDEFFKLENIVYDNGSYGSKVPMYLEGAKRLGVPISECLIYEDSKHGIEDAITVGAREVVVVRMHIDDMQEMDDVTDQIVSFLKEDKRI